MAELSSLEFKEVQKFDHWALWLIISIVFFTFIGLGVFWESDRMLWATLIPGIPVIILLVLTRLKTTINNNGIYIKFFPIYAFDKVIQWKEIDDIYIRKYKPLKEYGGWGLRISYLHGLAYTISGNYGIQIIFKNGKKLMIGTQNRDEAMRIIQSIRDHSSISN